MTNSFLKYYFFIQSILLVSSCYTPDAFALSRVQTTLLSDSPQLPSTNDNYRQYHESGDNLSRAINLDLTDSAVPSKLNACSKTQKKFSQRKNLLILGGGEAVPM
jgi:hypothetical protein